MVFFVWFFFIFYYTISGSWYYLLFLFHNYQWITITLGAEASPGGGDIIWNIRKRDKVKLVLIISLSSFEILRILPMSSGFFFYFFFFTNFQQKRYSHALSIAQGIILLIIFKNGCSKISKELGPTCKKTTHSQIFNRISQTIAEICPDFTYCYGA